MASPGKDHGRTMTSHCLVNNIALVLPEHTIFLGALMRFLKPVLLEHCLPHPPLARTPSQGEVDLF